MSSPEITITLGRTGQVVTKGGKRPRGEGFESSGDSSLFSSNRRNQGDGMTKGLVLNGVNGSQIAQNDLRLKLMRKRLSKKIRNVEEEKIDPHKKLVKVIHPPLSSVSSYIAPRPLGPAHAGGTVSRQMLPKEIPNDMHKVDSLGEFYSYQSIGRLRGRSPDQFLKSHSRLSPPRNCDETWNATSPRTTDLPRGGRLLSDEILDASRWTGTPQVIVKTNSQAGNLVKPAAPSGFAHAISHMGEEPQTLAGFLHSLGLGKYVVSFEAEEVDMTVLRQMGDNDLKEMGIPMGPRKKILLALLARLKRQRF